MYRTFTAVLLAILIVSFSPISTAQTTRAYAPENLSQLSVADQIRVIDREYSEQSRGREIPDDQLDFYLDQIKYSRWTFSRIKSDISTSLGGNGNWRPPSNGGWKPVSVICSSRDRRYNECRTHFRGRARLVENISSTRCIEGQSWGSRQGMVWVDNGCRARFIDSGNGWGGGDWNNRTFTCESSGNRYRECRKPYSGNATLTRQLSGTRCVQGRTWGQKSNEVWVSGGCRGEFSMRDGNWGGSNYSVTCSSFSNRTQTCAWNLREGTPVIIDHLAGRCQQNRDWGYSRGSIWVKNGCSARFGARR